MRAFAREYEAVVTRLSIGAALGLVVTMGAHVAANPPAASVASPLPGDTHLPADSVRGALSASIQSGDAK